MNSVTRQAVGVVAILYSIWFVLFGGAALAATSAEVVVQRQMTAMIGEFLARFKLGMKDSERSVFDLIEFSVPIDPAPIRVWAFRDSQNIRRIEISTGFGAITRMIARAFTFGVVLGNPAKGLEFAKYVADNYGNPKETGIQTPTEFLDLDPAEAAQRLETDQFQRAEVGQFQLALGYVLAHEIAHHVLGHTSSNPQNKSESRARETAADAWASRVLIRADIPPLGAILALAYWHSMEPNALFYENRRTHPPELRRMRDNLKLTLRFIERNVARDSRIGTMSSKQIQRDVLRGYIRMEALIADAEGRDLSLPSSQCLRERTARCIHSCTTRYGHSSNRCKTHFCATSRHYAQARYICDE